MDGGKPYPEEDYGPYDGKVIVHEIGWNGEVTIVLSDLLETAGREFPGVALSELGITLYQESMIILHELKRRVP